MKVLSVRTIEKSEIVTQAAPAALPAGVTVTPYLQPHYSKKKGGHPLVLRVTASKQHVYLPTSLFVEKKGFNDAKKVLTNPEAQAELDVYTGAAWSLIKTHDSDLNTIKANWDGTKTGVKVDKSVMSFFERHQHYNLDMMIEERASLEKQLEELNIAIEAASKTLKRVPTKRVATSGEKQTFRDALLGFQATWKLLKARDQQAWTSWLTILEECCKAEKMVLTLDLFSLEFYARYAHHILHTRDNYDNTFGAHVKRLKSFLKWAEQTGYTVNPGYKDRRFKILEEEKEVVYLDDEELNMLWAYKSMVPRWTKVIDLATFQNLCGFRVSDLMKQHLVSTDGGHKFLSGITKKNKGAYSVPLSLDPRIREILAAYDYNLAILSEAQYNKQLKVVLTHMYQDLGMELPIVEVRPTKLGVAYPYFSTKPDEISSHSMRRSFCTRHINGSHFNQNDILKMLGSKDLKELQKYMKTETQSLHRKAEAAAS